MKPRLKIFWFALVLMFLPSVSSWAGEITLDVESTVHVTGRRVETDFTVMNNGNEVAKDISLTAVLEGQKRKAWVGREILPGKSKSVKIAFDLIPQAHGAFPIFITVSYRSEDGASFSGAALGIARTYDFPKRKIAIIPQRRSKNQGT